MPETVLEQRVERLEDESREFRDDLRQIRTDLAFIRGRLETLPSTWVMPTGIIGGQIALAGVLIAASRLLGNH
ncbi:MAG: hypothetical protein JO047_17845 [Alphaproteobacteria bacterium]|nr:hypothetical protein [Alphaproteobacteria bacterium]